VTVRFPDGGFQSIVLQTREAGVSIDQVILSSEKYMTTRPGAAKNDHTILQFTYCRTRGELHRAADSLPPEGGRHK
jgi:hypothetical protein